MRTRSVCSVLAFIAFYSSQVLAWGGKGHEAVNEVAISMVANPQAKKFLDTNSKEIIRFANTPDVKWKSGPNSDKERPMHFFEMDSYGKNRLGEGLTGVAFGRALEELGKEYMNDNGLAMWRISDLYVRLVAALKKADFKQAVQIAGVMGHYVGDITQPMHATSDYDGQSINKPGVHKYYETTLVDQISASHLIDSVQKVAGERRSGLERAIGNDLDNAELQHLAWTEADDSMNALETVYDRFDHEKPDDKWLKQDLMPRIGRAAALLGKIWDVAFTVAGTEKLPSRSVEARDPEWIPLANY